MLYMDKMENLKLYRAAKIFVPMDEKDFNRGTVVYLNTKNINKSIDVINSTNIKNTLRIKSYFVDFIYKLKLFNKPLFEKKDSSDIYLQIKDKCKYVKRTQKFFKYNKRFNAYYDLHMYNQYFETRSEKYRGDRMINEYLNLLKSIDSKVDNKSYPNKVMIIDLDGWGVNVKDEINYKYAKARDPFQLIYGAMLRNIESFKELQFDILFMSDKKFLKVTPSKCDNKSYLQLRAQLKKMNNSGNVKSDDIVDMIVDKDTTESTPDTVNMNVKERDDSPKAEVAQNIKDKLLDKLANGDSDLKVKRFSFTGDTDLQAVIDKKVEETVEDEDLQDEEDIEQAEKKVEAKLDEDEDFLQKVELLKMDKVTNTLSSNNLKRNKLLAEKQAKVKVEGKTLEDILKEVQDKTIEPKPIKIQTLNERMTKNKTAAFESQYNKKLLDKDTVAILNFFKDRSIPVYILDVKKIDSSDEFSKKFTYTVKMESADRVRHTLTFDMPKFVDDSFLYLNGNKKTIVKQLMLNPVSKTGPDTVQICTNYNKIFMSRTGTKLSPKIERLKKALAEFRGNKTTLYFKEGDNTLSNSEYKTIMEFDELASSYMDISIYNEVFIYFNQNTCRKILETEGIKFDSKNVDMLPVGYVSKGNKRQALLLDLNKNVIAGTGLSLPDFITESISNKKPEFKDQMLKTSVGKKYIYTKVKVMKKDVPLVLFLAYLEGLTTVMKKAGIKFTFSDTRIQLKDDDRNNKDIIEFADGYLVYDRSTLADSLLMNGLSAIPTKAYNYSDMDDRNSYLDIFDELLGVRMIANAFDNFYDLMIDPITLEILNDFNLPTSFVDLLIYANSLLEDNQFIKENDMSLYRIRSNEIVNAYLYKALSDAYSNYRLTYGNKNPVKMSIPQDQVIKDILMSNIVEDYSTLNPILEAEKLRAVSYKGPSGRRSATLYWRQYMTNHVNC